MNGFATHLDQQISNSIASLLDRLSVWKPVQLTQEVVTIGSKYGEALGNMKRSDRLEAAIGRLLNGGVASLTRFDHRVLAHNLATSHAMLGDRSLFQHMEYLEPLLERWQSDIRGARGALFIWRAVLLSVFDGGMDDPGVVRGRDFLGATWASVSEGDIQPDWLVTLQAHQEIFGKNPSWRYANDWLEGSTESLESLRLAVFISPGSWFWKHLVRNIIAAIEKRPDSIFRGQLDALLDFRKFLGGLSEIYTRPILQVALERYAKCSKRPRHDRLLEELISDWGSPQLMQSTDQHNWTLVSPGALAMVRSWLAEQDLEAFALLCKQLNQVDSGRLAYWLRFVRQVEYSQLIIGYDFLNSSDVDIRKFVKRERERGRLARLLDSPQNNAIVLKIGKWWFVEFSQKGNACYPYKEDACDLNFGERQYTLDELKSKEAVECSGAERLLHFDGWEERADEKLSWWGVRPDSVEVSRGRLPRE